MEKLEKVNLSVKIIDFTMEDFSLVEVLPVDVARSLDKSKIQFEFNVDMNLDIIKKQMIIHLNTNFFSEIEKRNKIGHIHTKGVFEVLNLDEIINQTNGTIPNGVLATFIGVTLSTTRGFLILKAANTFMEGAIIPIMNPMSFFESKSKAQEV